MADRDQRFACLANFAVPMNFPRGVPKIISTFFLIKAVSKVKTWSVLNLEKHCFENKAYSLQTSIYQSDQLL